MNKQEKIRDQLSAYIDGELTSAQAHRVEEAVEADAGLADDLAALRAVRDLVVSLPAARAPDDLLESIMQQAERGRLVDSSPRVPSRSHGAWRWFRRLSVAAVLAIATCIGVVIVSQVWNAGEDQLPIANREPDKPGGPIARGDDYEKGGKEGKSAFGRGYHNDMKGSAPDAFEIVLASADDVDIYTPDLVATQDRVERVLGRNSIEPAVLNNDGSITRAARHKGKSRARAAFSHANQISATQIQYEIYANQEQIDNIRKELGPVIAMQKVSQARVAESLTDAPHYKNTITNGAGRYVGGLGKSRSPKGGSSGQLESRRRGKLVASRAVQPGAAPTETEGIDKATAETRIADRMAGGKAGSGIASKAEAGQVESRPADTASAAVAQERPTGQAKEEVTDQRDLARLGLVTGRKGPATSPSPAVPGAARLDGRDNRLTEANAKVAPSSEGKDAAKKDFDESLPAGGKRDRSSLFAKLLRCLGVVESDGDEELAEGPIAASRPARSQDGKLMDRRLQPRGREEFQQAQRVETAGRDVAGRPEALRRGQASNIWQYDAQLGTSSQAVANVRRLVITLNYRQAVDDAHMMRAEALPSSRASKPEASEITAKD